MCARTGWNSRMPLAVPVPPVTPVVVQSPFTPAAHDWLPAHRGVDLAASPGQQVVSPRRGTVVFSGRIADREVMAVRSRGVRFTFEPVRSRTRVGEKVRRGTVIAVVGTGGHCSEVCLHFGAKVRGEYVDPMTFLARRAPVLKPVPSD